MANYFWKGQSLDDLTIDYYDQPGPYGTDRGEPARGLPLNSIPTRAERRKVNWNNPANWYIAYQGFNPLTGSGGSIGEQLQGIWYLLPAETAPGGGDTVYFERYDWDGESWPQSPCLMGGYWGDAGWLNASNTGGKADVIVNPNFGLDNYYFDDFEEYFGSTTRIGLDYSERVLLRGGADYTDDAAGYAYAGATCTGLSLNLNNLTVKANQILKLRLVRPDINACYLYGKNTKTIIAGGTLGDVYLDAKYYNNERGTDPNELVAGTFSMSNDEFIDPDDVSLSHVTGNAIWRNFKNTTDYTEYDQYDWLTNQYRGNPMIAGSVLLSNSKIQNVVVDMPYRDNQIHFHADIENFYSYPELVRPIGDSLSGGGSSVVDSYNAVRLGGYRLNTINITNLNIRSSTERLSITKDTVPAGYPDPPENDDSYWLGVNNMVGVDIDCTISNLNVDSGKFLLGTRNISRNYNLIGCELDPGENVRIVDGRIAKNGIMDLRHPTDATYKGVHIGAGVSPEGPGVKVYNEEGLILPPRQSRIKIDYEETGPTLDIEPSRSETFPSI